jgi:hypothetical protein
VRGRGGRSGKGNIRKIKLKDSKALISLENILVSSCAKHVVGEAGR